MKVAMKITQNRGHVDSTTIRELGNPAGGIASVDYLSADFAHVLDSRLRTDYASARIKKVVINVILED